MHIEGQNITANLFQLINQNCTDKSAKARIIQKAILKKFFKASEVIITERENTFHITMKPVLSSAPETEVTLEIPQKHIASLLQDCIKNDPKGRANSSQK
ncbi:hypothetical protein [Leeuwenhoekiella marinoflava]|uniref:Uncharacterized protein n=2 Tax=Leeuwenhoekiella marinoflava TaxID=988 RepID=A0A4Q0PNE5_9FLAO|nr:hypothetical protein [Leeuwenhoekiella marinoflava]RXG31622.1 hypothetical protein DSL99_1440 [Leeuwenhoekiella marinoflava]SHF10621.1 hypothetical protein SAMN02745246_01741 [Leeuwenhoekiella marinoflava DSM 3653]